MARQRTALLATLKLSGHLGFLWRRLVIRVRPIKGDVILPCQRNVHLFHHVEYRFECQKGGTMFTFIVPSWSCPSKEGIGLNFQPHTASSTIPRLRADEIGASSHRA